MMAVKKCILIKLWYPFTVKVFTMKLETEKFRLEDLNKTGINNPKTNVSIVANPLKETIV